MNVEKKKIDINAIQDITVQLTNIAERMALIDDLHGQGWPVTMENIIAQTVKDIAGNALADVHQIFQTMDKHTNVRSFLDKFEQGIAFPKEVCDGSQNPREKAR